MIRNEGHRRMISRDFQASDSPVVVAGDGWAALAAVGFLASSGMPVRWIVGSGTRLLSPLPSFEPGPGLKGWELLARAVGRDDVGEPAYGTYHREFRNKAFREPAWSRSP